MVQVYKVHFQSELFWGFWGYIYLFALAIKICATEKAKHGSNQHDALLSLTENKPSLNLN